MVINRRKLRHKLGSRAARRQGTKHGKIHKPRPRTRLAELVEKFKIEVLKTEPILQINLSTDSVVGAERIL